MHERRPFIHILIKLKITHEQKESKKKKKPVEHPRDQGDKATSKLVAASSSAAFFFFKVSLEYNKQKLTKQQKKGKKIDNICGERKIQGSE